MELFRAVPGVSVFGEPSGASPRTVGFPEPTRDNFWLTSIVVDPRDAAFTTEELRLALQASGIEARPLWKPMHRQPVYREARVYHDGTADRLFRTVLSLPSGSALTAHQVERIDVALHQFLGMHHAAA